GTTRGDVYFGFRGAGSIGDLVWHDLDGDGAQDANEPGLPAVAVRLTWLGFDGATGGGDDVVFTTTTDAGGHYSFANLPAGNFRVDVLAATLPDNAAATYDLEGGGDGSALRALAAGETATDVDFGYRGDATIGDRVWYDVDGDGVLDASAADGFEPGITG